MSIAITEEHAALAGAARRFLATHCPPAVARAALDSEREDLPEFWGPMAGLGWLGLHVPEADGGQGYGLAELAVVVEELGRAAAPGPFLPTVLAIAAVAGGATSELKSALLPELLSGRAVGAVAFPGSAAMTGRRAGGDLVVSGTARPVLGAALADWLVVPVDVDGTEVLCVVPAAEADVTELASLDPTRRVASITGDKLLVPAERRLTMTRAQLDDLVAVLVAAECAGGAGWCLDTGSEYAKVREQFGRPIGQFQAVKHRLADMLISVEQLRAAAWDAALAQDESSADEARLPVSIAAALGPDLYARVAKDCVQVLGGIGFTWEHDAHRYLRRAVTLRQLTGGTHKWRLQAAGLASAGARRQTALGLPGADDAVRRRIHDEVAAIAARPRSEWRPALVESGFMVPHWPEPWGRGASPLEQLVIDDELRRAGIRRPHLGVGAWAAPTIATHGSPEQQDRWVGPTLLGNTTWCQLFSEPGAGSDLASLSTKAVRAEGGWSITGQKVWTSMAADADWGMCLARTDGSRPKHLGITYFIVDMKSPGLEIRPLRELTGHAMFNEVFLSDVFVPDDAVVGEVDGGWPLARTTLANERVAMGSGASFGGGIESLLSLVAERGLENFDEVVRDELGALICESHTVSMLGLRATQRAVAGGGPGPESSVRKLLSAEHDQRTQEFGLSLLGGDGATTDGVAGQWVFGFLANRCLTIAGGTSEVQRNVIAERLLGLPRDPEPPA